MRGEQIRQAYDSLSLSPLEKAALLEKIKGAPARKRARKNRPMYQKRYMEPERSPLLPVLAAVGFVLLAGAMLAWLRSSPENTASFTAPPETIQTEAAETAGLTREELTLCAQALLSHPDLSSEILSAVTGQPESTSTHHVYTFFDWDSNGKTELLVGLWNGNAAYRGSDTSVTYQVRLEDGQAVISPFTGDGHTAYLCEGGFIEDVFLQESVILPPGEGTPVLRVYYDDSRAHWFRMPDAPGAEEYIPISEAEKDSLLAGYPHLVLDWRPILEFPGLDLLLDTAGTAP